MKATSQDCWIENGAALSFPLDVRTYNRLRIEDRGFPVYLIVLSMPDAMRSTRPAASGRRQPGRNADRVATAPRRNRFHAAASSPILENALADGN